MAFKEMSVADMTGLESYFCRFVCSGDGDDAGEGMTST